MRFFRRGTSARRPERPNDSGSAAADALRAFEEAAHASRLRESYVDVTSAFGALIEQHASDVLPRSEAELPYSRDLIWRALMVTIALHVPQREHAKAAAIVHLQQYLSREELAPYVASLEAARAFMRSLAAGPDQGLEAARYVGDALQRIRPLQREVHRRTRKAEYDVAQRFAVFWGPQTYFSWRLTHLADSLDAAEDAVMTVRGIRGGDGPEAPDEKQHPEWPRYESRIVELTKLVQEAEAPLAQIEPAEQERHAMYRQLLTALFLAVAQVGAPADEDARIVGTENYTNISQALAKVREQEARAIEDAIRGISRS